MPDDITVMFWGHKQHCSCSTAPMLTEINAQQERGTDPLQVLESTLLATLLSRQARTEPHDCTP